MRKILSVIFILFTFFCGFLQAQEVEPVGKFDRDSLKIGEEIQYALSVRYPAYHDTIFPDSTFSVEPFEYRSKTYYPTKSDSLISFDSVVYTLTTFEIEPILNLQLPVIVVSGGDSVPVYPAADTIRLKQIVKTIDQDIQLKENTNLAEIPDKFNYPYVLIGLGAFSVLVILVILLFGRMIRKSYRIYMLKKSHKRFIKAFFAYMRDVTSNNPKNSPEHVLAYWKMYMEKLERKPFSKLTTKEIISQYKSDKLKDILKLIDRCIYAGESSEKLFNSFDFLLKFTSKRFQSHIRNLKKG